MKDLRGKVAVITGGASGICEVTVGPFVEEGASVLLADIQDDCIRQGAIATPIFGKSMGLSPERAEEVIPLMKGVLENFQPIKRTGLPDDIARAALWLASDESGFVNGHALVVDGGLIGGRLWSEVQQRREMFRATLGLT